MLYDFTRNPFLFSGSTSGELNGKRTIGGKDGFVMKLTSNGEEEYTVLLGTIGTDIATKVAVDSHDEVIVIGYTNGNMNDQMEIPSSKSDSFLTKIDSNGEIKWTNQFGTKEDEKS